MTWRLVVVGNLGCRRVKFWRAAALRLGWIGVIVVPYERLLRDGAHLLAETLKVGDVVRIETPGEDSATFKLLLKHGFDDAQRIGYPAISADIIEQLPLERGWLVQPRQAFLGYCRLLAEMANVIGETEAEVMHAPGDIVDCFDKPTCQERLEASGLPVPRRFGVVADYANLRKLARSESRVMLKLAHGSGGAGCIAVHAGAERIRGITTVAEVVVAGERRLYHSKRVRQITDERELARIVDRLCVERMHAEAWLPKANWAGRNVDLRIVTIAGEARHVVARSGNSVFTNLTLGNRKADAAGIIDRIGPIAWQTIRETCARAADVFASCFTLGLDVLVRPDWVRHVVLEVNAFGDLLVDQVDRGDDTYAATLRAWQLRKRAWFN